MKNLKKIAITTMMASPFLLDAQGFQVNLQGQKQQGMGGAGTAYMQDAAAVFFNPGGMSFLKENSINLGATATIANSTFLDANTNSVSRTNSPVSTPFAGYAVWGVKDSSHCVKNEKLLNTLKKLKFGLGVYTPFGSIVKWEDGWAGRFALTSLQLQAIYIQPTVSYKINNKLGIGAGFVYANGQVELKQDLPLVDAHGNYGSADLKGKANGLGYNLGVYYQPTEKLSFGLTYRSQVKMKVNDGTATFVVPSSLNSNFPSGSFSSSLPLPSVLTLGIAYKATDKLAFALDVNYVGWKSYDTLAFDYKQNTASLQDTKLPRDYQNTFAFRLGGQYKITNNFTARLGLSVPISPIKDGYVTPEVPDATRLNYTAGLGYKITKRFVIDASYTFENFKRKDHNTSLGLDGTYKTYISAIGLSLIYNF